MSLAASPHSCRLRCHRARRSIPSKGIGGSSIYSVKFGSDPAMQPAGWRNCNWRLDSSRPRTPTAAAMDEDFVDIPSFSEERDEFDAGDGSYLLSSSEDEFEADWPTNSTSDLDLPMRKDHLETSNAAFTVTAHRFVTLQTGGRKRRKRLVPLPPPLGLVGVGKFYSVLTAFCFVTIGNGITFTDGLDGLAGGAAALAFIGMAVAALPICSELAVFGASMAGTCIGFLFHNRYRASVYMGGTGSLALGGGLAAMAACTGMFFPLFISSGIFVLEVSSVVIQVLSAKAIKCVYGSARHLFWMAPLHHLLQLYGIKEPVIVANAYVVSCILALCAGYVGLISA